MLKTVSWSITTWKYNNLF